MAQGDYLIQNQSFPSFRSDLNSTLEAINTSNSGTSRPSSAVAGTIWLDTTNATNPTLKLYDGADDISLATFDYSANTVNWLDSVVSGGDVVDDTTPQLGGNLDVNGNSIVSVSNGNISITPDGTGKVIVDGLSHPTADGTSGQNIITDGAGNLSFSNVIPADNTVSLAKLTATGTKDSTTFLRGDNTFATVGGGGKVLQVIQGIYSTETTTSSTSYVTTGLDASITPSSSSNKVLIMVSGSGRNDGSNSAYSIFRDSTDLCTSSASFGNIGSGNKAFYSLSKLDSPSSTSAITYSFRFRNTGGGGTAYIAHNNSDTTITLMEIDGT